MLCFELEVLISESVLCLCVAGSHTHTWHPTATCRMPLREMPVHSLTVLHEMVFLEVTMKYFFKILCQQPGLFALLPCFTVHFVFFCILTPCSLVGGYKSLSSLISHTDIAAVSGLGKLLMNGILDLDNEGSTIHQNIS